MGSKEVAFHAYPEGPLPSKVSYLLGGVNCVTTSSMFNIPEIGPSLDLVSGAVRGGKTGGYISEIVLDREGLLCAETVKLLPVVFGFGSRQDVFFERFSTNKRIKDLAKILPGIEITGSEIRFKIGEKVVTTLTSDQGFTAIDYVNRASRHNEMRECVAGHNRCFYLESRRVIRDEKYGSGFDISAHFDLGFDDPKEVTRKVYAVVEDGVDEGRIRELIDVSLVINGIL